MSRRPERAAARQEPDAERRRDWLPRFVRNVLLLLIPAWALWAFLTPAYNRFLLQSAQNLLHLTERPAVTQFVRQSPDDALITRRDLPPAKSVLARGIRVTDLHFHLVLLGALFLAVPGVPWRRRLENVAWALLVAVCFDILLLFLHVKAAYATELGAWSLQHYGPFARNAYGLAMHLLDLPFKLALPIMLWTAFYLSFLTARRAARPLDR